MKLKTMQRLYKVMMPHENTVEGAIKWWLKGGNGECRHFCPTCQLYFACQEYVAEREILEKRLNEHE